MKDNDMEDVFTEAEKGKRDVAVVGSGGSGASRALLNLTMMGAAIGMPTLVADAIDDVMIRLPRQKLESVKGAQEAARRRRQIERGEWVEFETFAYQKWVDVLTIGTFSQWLTDPKTYCRVCGEWRKMKGEK